MSMLKSEEEFLEQLKKWKASGTVPPELVKFLEEVYASKLYYQYYSRFLGAHYATVIEQFTKLYKNPKSTASQLRSALEIACSDIAELHMQVEDYRQDEDYEESKKDKEESFEDKRPSNVWDIINLIVTLILTGIVLFK